MNRGDVVVVDWIYSDRTGSKLRPAVMIQSDVLNALIADTVLVGITGQSRSATTEVLLDPALEMQSGLTRVSYAVCNNLMTLDQGLIIRRIGQLSGAALQQIEQTIKTALELP
jgi:mRNA interferase MazF